MNLPDMTQPAILVIADPAAEQHLWRPMLLGMEEEGIPFAITPTENSGLSLNALAHRASSASPLAVGVAVGRRELVVHDPHLPEQQPLFVLTDYTRRTEDELRRLGCNAARLVKGLPFK